MIQFIIETVLRYHEIDTEYLKSNSRKRDVVQARHEVSYFGMKYTKLSSMKIGLIINKSHCSVLYSRNLIREYVEMGLEKTYLGHVFQDIKEEIEGKVNLIEKENKIKEEADRIKQEENESINEVEQLIDQELEYCLTLK